MITLIKAQGTPVTIELVIDRGNAIATFKKSLSTDVIPYVRAANCILLISLPDCKIRFDNVAFNNL